MKGLVITFGMLLAAALANTLLAASPGPGGFTVAAGDFVSLLAKKDYSGAVAGFDATMKQALPEAKLREVWEAVQAQAGPFKKQLSTRTGKVAGYEVVLVTCQFEKTNLDTKVVFDSKGQVAGLFFVPTQAAAASPPPYAREGAYREKELKVGKGEWVLPGTLTLPSGNGPWPAVVLVHGSGPEDRDETIAANKPFRDLAWGLASKGIAVLRYEKRTKEYGRKMANDVCAITLKEETIDDALDAVEKLRAEKEINGKRVFVLGHSLGGVAAPRIGQADPNLAGLIILAGSTRPLEDIVLDQLDYLASLGGSGTSAEMAKMEQIRADVAKVRKLTPADVSSTNLLIGGSARYWLDLRNHDTLAIARTLRQPLLILQGQRDYQVTQADFDGWKKALGDSPNATLKLYPKLNHLFMPGEGKSTPSEYEQGGHVAEAVVNDIAAWIEAR